MIDIDDFREYSGEHSAPSGPIERAVSTGIALVDVLCAGVDDIPDSVKDTAYLICAARVYANHSAPDGVSQFASADGTPRYIARDPLEAVRPLVRPYLGWVS